MLNDLGIVELFIYLFYYFIDWIFFFLISKNVIYTNGYSMHEEHRANPKNTRRKQKKKPIHRLITKRKRANERRERITSCELGCTDTPFLASCQCRTRIGHRNGYDSPDSSVRRVSSFFFFFSFLRHALTRRRHGSDAAPTRFWRVWHASSEEKKENFGIFRVIPAISAEMKISSDTRFWLEQKKKNQNPTSFWVSCFSSSSSSS